MLTDEDWAGAAFFAVVEDTAVTGLDVLVVLSLSITDNDDGLTVASVVTLEEA